MTRWLKRIAQFLLLALLALSAAFGVWVFHTLPMVDGALKVAGLSQRVQINRDADDVVHIQAQSNRDAAFALGFAHAQDRSWQLEFNRRVMHGELSEILGEVTLPTDKLMRTLGLMQAAQRQYDNLPAEVRTATASTAFMRTAHRDCRLSLPCCAPNPAAHQASLGSPSTAWLGRW
jgi:penicillin G amidase